MICVCFLSFVIVFMCCLGVVVSWVVEGFSVRFFLSISELFLSLGLMVFAVMFPCVVVVSGVVTRGVT